MKSSIFYWRKILLLHSIKNNIINQILDNDIMKNLLELSKKEEYNVFFPQFFITFSFANF